MTNTAGRAELVNEIDALCERVAAESRSPARQDRESVGLAEDGSPFDLERLLAFGADTATARLGDAQLDRLRRKIEVARKVYRVYEQDISRPTSSQPLSPDGINQLCAVMLLAALRRRDARFLNAALKLIDGLHEPAGVQVSQRLSSLTQETLDLLLPLGRAP